MNDNVAARVHWSFWAIATVGLVWNILGAINFFMQMNSDVVAAMPETHRAIIEGRPVWATAGFAIAVFGGALGCFLLLLRRSAAFQLFVASLVGVLATMVHTMGVGSSNTSFSPFEIVMMIVMPMAVAGFLVLYSKQAESKGWIK